MPENEQKSPRIKICGVRTSEEALLAARLGADFLGLNFHPPSPRYLDPEEAALLAADIRRETPDVGLVGVFVNRPLEDILAIEKTVGLDLLQFSGDETAAEMAPVADRAIKGFRISGSLDADFAIGFDQVWGHLVDYRHPTLYGGSGESWDFSSLAGLKLTRPTFIAGGLNPDNVAAAIQAAAPWGVDVCSGIEAEPGRKDPELLGRFFKVIKENHHG